MTETRAWLTYMFYAEMNYIKHSEHGACQFNYKGLSLKNKVAQKQGV